MNKYLAFISYRHQPESMDASVRIRRGLEGHHLPSDCPLPKHRKVFRDTDELPTSSDLGMDIENALRGSDYLIALCTEEYIRSKWCLREVEMYLQLGRRDRILPVLLSGTPETSMPKELQELPLAADLRGLVPDGSSGAGTYDRKKIRAAIPQLLSRMSGMDADRIAQAEFRFRAVTAAAAVAVCTAGLLGFAGYATSTAKRIADNNAQIEQAMENTEKAERQALEERDTALLRQAQYLSRQSLQSLLDGNNDEAIRLALSALPEDLHGDLPVSAEAEGMLRLALSMDLPPVYHFLKAAETDFDITGYYLHSRQSDKVLLIKEPFGTDAPYVDYTGEAGVVETDFAESRQKALDMGYTKLWYLAGDVNSRRHFYYGGGKPLFSEGDMGFYSTPQYTLHGEPFCPEYLIGDTANEQLLAWEASGDGTVPRMALFANGKPEALAELKLTGVPVSVSPSGNGSWILVVYEDGTLSIYDYQGVCLKTLEGDFTCAYFYSSGGYYACVGSEDGTVRVLDLDSFEETLRFSCSSSVRQITGNRDKNCLLVRCDSGVYLYQFKTGAFVTEVGENAAPKYVFWKDERSGGKSDASIIVMIYDRRVEIYTMSTETDSSIAEYRPLFKEGVPPGHDMTYSGDGRYIYQKASLGNVIDGPGEDMLYCWDAHTGELLWESSNEKDSYASTFTLSADSRTVWRIYEESSTQGVERLDGSTGEKLVSVHWDGEFWQPLEGYPVESPDGTKAFLIMQYSSSNSYNRSVLFVLFDPVTGELLRRMDLDADSAYWTERQEEKAEEAAGSPDGDAAEKAAAGTEMSEAGETADTAATDETEDTEVTEGTEGTESAADSDVEAEAEAETETEAEAMKAGTADDTKKASASDSGTARIRPQERTGFAKAAFSADGTRIYVVQNAVRKDSGVAGVCIDRLDAGTGEIMDEQFLETGEVEFSLWEEEEALVLIDRQDEEYIHNVSNIYTGGTWIYPEYIAARSKTPVTHVVRIIDLTGKRPETKTPVTYYSSPEILNRTLTTVRPYEGGMALYWDAENEDRDGESFCCRLNRDGTTGPVYHADSGPGRKLWVSKDNYLLFNGQEAYFAQAGIRRISDGTLLMADVRSTSAKAIKNTSDKADTRGGGDKYGIAAAKDGQSICMYSPQSGATSTYPVLILPSDLDTLVEKAKRRIGEE
ncbi:MAG: TIR domain-containing protein [Lachnospiraceae bacterium]|nr:TIR domain-containing protein [Lachnospiraceae bacterium]